MCVLMYRNSVVSACLSTPSHHIRSRALAARVRSFPSHGMATHQCIDRNAGVQPQDAYGLEKLASEELGKHYGNDFGIDVRIARFHNIYGPYGTWKGGREKAPAAFCRKVRGSASLSGSASRPGIATVLCVDACCCAI